MPSEVVVSCSFCQQDYTFNTNVYPPEEARYMVYMHPACKAKYKKRMKEFDKALAKLRRYPRLK